MGNKNNYIGIIISRMALFIVIFSFHFSVFNFIHAQEPETFNVTVHDSSGGSHTETFELPLSMTYPIDSLLADWKAKNYIDLGKDCSRKTSTPLSSPMAK